uniref:Uncharacterized protein n=1 Tax=Scleropages formosus TaxID=113540 RepID=A0A8C9R657_SCLFO
MVLQRQPSLAHDTSGPMLHSPSPMGMPNMNLPYPQPPDDMLPHHQLHLLSKHLPHQRTSHPPDSFHSMSAGNSPDLSDVIQPMPTGILEINLSRIIPANKPSSTLQYFSKSEMLPHLHLQNMMAEQQLAPLHSAHSNMCGGLGATGPICHPGHGMGRTAMMHQQQQATMGNNVLHHPSHPHPSMIMSISGDPYDQQGLLTSPQGPLMGLPHPHLGMMDPQATGMSLDSPLGYGHGAMVNIPF